MADEYDYERQMRELGLSDTEEDFLKKKSRKKSKDKRDEELQ